MSFDPDARTESGQVRFAMHFPDTIRMVYVTEDTLREYFGADGSPAGMLDAYRANYRVIHSVAQIVGMRGEGDIVVTPDDVRAAGCIAKGSSPP
jgi:hypothetical protein